MRFQFIRLFSALLLGVGVSTFSYAAELESAAAQKILSLAEKGEASAQELLGGIYFLGEGTKKDYVKAKEWYEKAAEQDYAKAQTNLGMMYSDGLGVRKDYVKAKEWFSKACENGEQNSCAEYNRLIRQGF